MAQFQAFDPNVEVSGEAILLFVDALGLFKRMAVKILANHGIADVTGKTWYPQQAYLDAYREIYQEVGEKTLKAIGKQVPDKALWPPDVKTIEQALASIDIAYHMNNRGGEVGYYKFEKTRERSGKMVCYNPYPCPFDQALIDATGNKFAPQGIHVRVVHDKGSCRQKGADSCTYLISW